MTRYDPFEEMDRVFDQFRTRMRDADHPLGTGSFGTRSDLPARGRSDVNMDLEKRDGEYVFVADLPGFEKDEIDLTIEDDALVLAAECEVSEDKLSDTGELELRRSRRVAERVILPEEIATEDITATYRNGVLEVHLPLVEGAEDEDGERIDIED